MFWKRDKKMLPKIESLVNEGRFEEVLEVLGHIKDPEYRNITSKMIAENIAKRDFKEIARLVAKAKANHEYSLIFDVIHELAKQGRLNESLKIVSEMPEDLHSSCYYGLVNGLIESKRLKDALKFVDEIKEFDRSEVLKDIAIELSSSGEFEEALNITNKITNDHFRMYALATIAKSLYDNGKDYEVALRESLEIAEKLVKRHEIVTEDEVDMLKSDEQASLGVEAITRMIESRHVTVAVHTLAFKHAELVIGTVENILQIMKDKIDKKTLSEITKLNDKAKSKLDKIREKLEFSIESISDAYDLGLEALKMLIREAG